jgi:hypothetical protein
MSKSNLYVSAVSAKQNLLASLEKLDKYLVEGTAKSFVAFYGKNNQILAKRSYKSKYTSSIGRTRVKTIHTEWIESMTKNQAPVGTTRIKVTSTFVNPGTTQATIKVPANVEVVNATI